MHERFEIFYEIRFGSVEALVIILLNSCQNSLQHAYHTSKVTDKGQQLIEIIFENTSHLEETYNRAKTYLQEKKSPYFAQFSQMKKDLKSKLIKYSLN